MDLLHGNIPKLPTSAVDRARTCSMYTKHGYGCHCAKDNIFSSVLPSHVRACLENKRRGFFSLAPSGVTRTFFSVTRDFEFLNKQCDNFFVVWALAKF